MRRSGRGLVFLLPPGARVEPPCPPLLTLSEAAARGDSCSAHVATARGEAAREPPT